MESIIVDTSVWIDFFNGINSEEVDKFSTIMESEVIIWLTPTILQEILQGFTIDKDFKLAKGLLNDFPLFYLDPRDAAIGAAELYRKMKKAGKTIRKSNDCLIAYYAIEKGIPLLQKDRDFEIMAGVVELKLV